MTGAVSETMPAYSASKRAIVMLTRSAAKCEAPYGIRVNWRSREVLLGEIALAAAVTDVSGRPVGAIPHAVSAT